MKIADNIHLAFWDRYNPAEAFDSFFPIRYDPRQYYDIGLLEALTDTQNIFYSRLSRGLDQIGASSCPQDRTIAGLLEQSLSKAKCKGVLELEKHLLSGLGWRDYLRQEWAVLRPVSLYALWALANQADVSRLEWKGVVQVVGQWPLVHRCVEASLPGRLQRSSSKILTTMPPRISVYDSLVAAQKGREGTPQEKVALTSTLHDIDHEISQAYWVDRLKRCVKTSVLTKAGE